MKKENFFRIAAEPISFLLLSLDWKAKLPKFSCQEPTPSQAATLWPDGSADGFGIKDSVYLFPSSERASGSQGAFQVAESPGTYLLF